MRNPLNLADRLYLFLFYTRRFLNYDLPENQVGWRSRRNQELRFQALTGIGELSGMRILDWGCGLGCLYGFLRDRGWKGEYTGIDILGFMVRGARRRFPGIPFERRDILNRPPKHKWDYVLINGVFNHKVRDNWDWMERTIAVLLPLAEKGLACLGRSDFAPIIVTFCLACIDDGVRQSRGQ